MIYLGIKNNEVIFHASKQAMRDMDGIEPAKEITEEEFAKAEGLFRLINGEIVIGKTKEEKQAEEDKARMAEIDAELRKIDIASARSARAIALAYTKGEPPAQADVAKIEDYEDQAQLLRVERAALNC